MRFCLVGNLPASRGRSDHRTRCHDVYSRRVVHGYSCFNSSADKDCFEKVVKTMEPRKFRIRRKSVIKRLLGLMDRDSCLIALAGFTSFFCGIQAANGKEMSFNEITTLMSIFGLSLVVMIPFINMRKSAKNKSL